MFGSVKVKNAFHIFDQTLWYEVEFHKIMMKLTSMSVSDPCRQILSKLYFAEICDNCIVDFLQDKTVEIEIVGIFWDSSNSEMRNLLEDIK